MSVARTPTPRNPAGLTWHQVTMLRRATAHMAPTECEQFLVRVMRLLAAWGKPPPEATDAVLVQAITAVELLDSVRERGVDAYEVGEDALR